MRCARWASAPLRLLTKSPSFWRGLCLCNRLGQTSPSILRTNSVFVRLLPESQARNAEQPRGRTDVAAVSPQGFRDVTRQIDVGTTTGESANTTVRVFGDTPVCRRDLRPQAWAMGCSVQHGTNFSSLTFQHPLPSRNLKGSGTSLINPGRSLKDRRGGSSQGLWREPVEFAAETRRLIIEGYQGGSS